jgi:hypothetical protein
MKEALLSVAVAAWLYRARRQQSNAKVAAQSTTLKRPRASIKNNQLDTLSTDFLYHLGLSTSDDLVQLLGGTRYFLCGGTAKRMRSIAKHQLSPLFGGVQEIGKEDRYVLLRFVIKSSSQFPHTHLASFRVDVALFYLPLMAWECPQYRYCCMKSQRHSTTLIPLQAANFFVSEPAGGSVWNRAQ